MRARVFIGFVIVLELALIVGPRWARQSSVPEGFAAWGEPGAIVLAAPEGWQPVPEAMGTQLQLALIGDDASGAARRLSASHPISVQGMKTAQFFDAVRQIPAGPAEGAETLADGPVMVKGAQAAYRRELLISSQNPRSGQPATFHFSRLWVLTSREEVIEIQLIVEEPSLGDPSADILRTVQV